MKVEDILNLYDPCRDHFVWIATSLDVSVLDLMLGMQVQKSPYINMEVDSIGVRDKYLAIWPTDKDLERYLKKMKKKSVMRRLLKAYSRNFKLCFLYWKDAPEWKVHRQAVAGAIAVNILGLVVYIGICHSWLALINVWCILMIICAGWYGVYKQMQQDLKDKREREKK